jgi:hypothetical protein
MVGSQKSSSSKTGAQFTEHTWKFERCRAVCMIGEPGSCYTWISAGPLIPGSAVVNSYIRLVGPVRLCVMQKHSSYQIRWAAGPTRELSRGSHEDVATIVVTQVRKRVGGVHVPDHSSHPSVSQPVGYEGLPQVLPLGSAGSFCFLELKSKSIAFLLVRLCRFTWRVGGLGLRPWEEPGVVEYLKWVGNFYVNIFSKMPKDMLIEKDLSFQGANINLLFFILS